MHKPFILEKTPNKTNDSKYTQLYATVLPTQALSS
jgi:hypothetical protein